MNDTQADPDFTRLFELIKDIRIAMLTTFTAGGETHTRPMFTQNPEYSEPGVLWFLTDLKSAKVSEILNYPKVLATYSDRASNNYVVVSGTGDVVRDPERVKKVWSIHAKAWFPDGPDDPSIGLLRVRPTKGEYWDGPNKASYMLSLLKAVVTGTQPDGGAHRTVRV